MILYLEVDINMFHCFVKDDTDLFMINILISRNSVMATIFPHFWRKVHIDHTLTNSKKCIKFTKIVHQSFLELKCFPLCLKVTGFDAE